MTKSLSAREIVTDALSLIGKFTINDTARVRGGSTVVRCGSCQRLLYSLG